MTTPQEIAIAFADDLEKEIGPAAMAEVVSRNAEEPAGRGGICHSHDFCDANVVFAEAFQRVMGIPLDVDSDSHCDLSNAAWDLAVAETFKTHLQ